MEPSVSPELEEESIIIVYAGLETGLYATNMERGGELRVFELPGRAFIFGFIEERYKKKTLLEIQSIRKNVIFIAIKD